jgi:hypothetical protein
MQGPKRLTHFGLEIGDEAIGLERQLQRLIMSNWLWVLKARDFAASCLDP